MEKIKKESKEKRALPISLEVREVKSDDGVTKRMIVGTIKYNSESAEMRDWWGDRFVEELAAGVFDESLKVRGVVGLWSHDTAQVLGNTKANTLRLNSDSAGLDFELDLPSTRAGDDAYESIKRGDVDSVSFGMMVTKDKWSKIEREGKQLYKRSILNADLYEISPVAFPAYPANEVSCRSLDEYREAAKLHEADMAKRKLTLELELL